MQGIDRISYINKDKTMSQFYNVYNAKKGKNKLTAQRY